MPLKRVKKALKVFCPHQSLTLIFLILPEQLMDFSSKSKRCQGLKMEYSIQWHMLSNLMSCMAIWVSLNTRKSLRRYWRLFQSFWSSKIPTASRMIFYKKMTLGEMVFLNTSIGWKRIIFMVECLSWWLFRGGMIVSSTSIWRTIYYLWLSRWKAIGNTNTKFVC